MKFDTLIEHIKKDKFDPKNYNLTPGKKQVSVIPLRAQPFHKGHLELVNKAKYPVVIAIVKGLKTSKDKNKNPFDLTLQKEIIKKAKFPVKVITINAMSLPMLINTLRDLNMEPMEIIAGLDRKEDYGRQVIKYATPLKSQIKLITVNRDENSNKVDGISASKIREALKHNDYKTVKSMMINLDQELFDKMLHSIKA
jgi:citrate lyase synthetase